MYSLIFDFECAEGSVTEFTSLQNQKLITGDTSEDTDVRARDYT